MVVVRHNNMTVTYSSPHLPGWRMYTLLGLLQLRWRRRWMVCTTHTTTQHTTTMKSAHNITLHTLNRHENGLSTYINMPIVSVCRC